MASSVSSARRLSETDIREGPPGVSCRRGGVLPIRPDARRRMAVLEYALWVDRVSMGWMRCLKGIRWT